MIPLKLAMLMLTAFSPVNLEKVALVGGGCDPWLNPITTVMNQSSVMFQEKCQTIRHSSVDVKQ